ncbi:hypothetical protein TA3x_002458 [Tundrisphaera sp. TA3]|uniref:hypothetical protein n=1 Tax=Tundrisphaera sp. TA3 TaxID=3435775 RepID=UPI003EBFC7E0
MDEWGQDATPLGGVDTEIKELLGLFDVPSFARRGQDVEYGLSRLRLRCAAERAGMLDMVRLRLRQWAGVASGPEAARAAFAAPIDDLWAMAQAEAPRWAFVTAPPRRLRGVARDLIASVERFNRRWGKYLDAVDLDALNRQIEGYNRFYLLEKECSLGSAALASRHFVPLPPLARDALRAEFPLLPVPRLKS